MIANPLLGAGVFLLGTWLLVRWMQCSPRANPPSWFMRPLQDEDSE